MNKQHMGTKRWTVLVQIQKEEATDLDDKEPEIRRKLLSTSQFSPRSLRVEIERCFDLPVRSLQRTWGEIRLVLEAREVMLP